MTVPATPRQAVSQMFDVVSLLQLGIHSIQEFPVDASDTTNDDLALVGALTRTLEVARGLLLATIEHVDELLE